MALSLALHGVAVILLFAAGASGSATSSEPALFVELAMAAEKASEAPGQATQTSPQISEPSTTEASTSEFAKPEAAIDPPPAEMPPPPDFQKPATVDLPPPEDPPAVEFSELKAIELAPPQEPPPLRASELKPIEKSKPEPPRPIAKPAPAKPAANTGTSTAAKSAPARAQPFGGAGEAQLAASGFLPAPATVWEGKPRYRHPPTPAVYPSRAIELNQQGEVLVRIRLDTEGGAVEILLHRSSGHVLLDQAALTAVRGWHFLPALRDGRPVPCWVEIPVRFHLR